MKSLTMLLSTIISICLSMSPCFALAEFHEGAYVVEVENGQATVVNYTTNYFGELFITNSLDGYPVTRIAAMAFFKCSSMTAVTIPDSVTCIDDYAFSGVAVDGDYFGCTNLSNITIGNGVTNIGAGAFALSPALTNVLIGSNVAHVGIDAFFDCPKLTSIRVVTANEFFDSEDGVLYDEGMNMLVGYPGGKLESTYTIPANVTRIGNSAFAGCGRLKAISISDNVSEIGLEAFWNCYSLISIKIGGGVTNIGSGAFDFCYCLTNVYFEGNAPSLGGSSVFSSCPATIYYLPGKADWGASFSGRPTLCWNPTVVPNANLGFASGRFGFTIAGTTNIPVVVESTTNLATGIWLPVTNSTLGTSGSFCFSDPASTNTPACFYRIAWP